MNLSYEILLRASGAALAMLMLWQIFWHIRQLRKAELLALGNQFASECKSSLVAIQSDYRATVGFDVILDVIYRGWLWHFRVLDQVVISVTHPDPKVERELLQFAEESLYEFIGQTGRPSRSLFAVEPHPEEKTW